MLKIWQVEPVVDSLSKGPLLRKIIVVTLKILVGIALLSGLVMAMEMIDRLMSGISGSIEGLGILLSLVLTAAATFLAIKILLHRAKCISYDQESNYPVISLCELLLKTGGELWALGYTSLGLVSGIMVWFGGDSPTIPGLWVPISHNTPSFLLGLGTILSGLFQALVMLVLSYLLAELLLLLRNIAANNNS